MHIPDGYLGPQTYVALDAAIIPIWGVAAAKVKKTLKAKQVPLMALGAAFSFVIMMFNVPVIGGTTGHAVGATLIAILLGPWAAVISISIALVAQALLFGDGGITAIGANCLNMAVIMPFVGFYLYRLVAGDAPSRARQLLAAGVGSYVGIVAAAIAAGVEFGLQPLIAHSATGQPLYAPYPLSVSVPAMAVAHLLIGFIEAAVTVGVVAVFQRQDSSLLAMKPASHVARWMWAGLAALMLASPLGLLATGDAWGEWDAEGVAKSVGFVPSGMQQLGSFWSAAIPDYAPTFIKNPNAGYIAAAVIGGLLIAAATWGIARLLANKTDDASHTSPPAAA
jgi:cobalt/nickel transport system permease protein